MAPRKRGVGRVWRGRTTLGNAHAYQEHLRKETLPALRAIDGFQGAYVLRRVEDEAIDFLVLTIWTSQDAIHSFAGLDAERAVIPEAAARVLAHWDERATHYDIALTVSGAEE
jgi:heme-degrading monooxygenase HmoA